MKEPENAGLMVVQMLAAGFVMLAILGLIGVTIVAGMSVIATGDAFWLTEAVWFEELMERLGITVGLGFGIFCIIEAINGNPT